MLQPLAESKNLKLVDVSNPESKEFEKGYREYRELLNSYQQTIESNKRWVAKFEK